MSRYEAIRVVFDPPIESSDGKERITDAVIYDSASPGDDDDELA